MHGESDQAKVASETNTFALVWPCVRLIQSDFKILWPILSLGETIQYLWFFCGDNHGGKVTSKTVNFGWVYQVYLWSNQIGKFFDQQFFLKELIDILDFFYRDNHQSKVACETIIFTRMRPPGVSGPVGSQDSLIISISGRNQLIPLPGHSHLNFIFLFPGIFHET